ncbi:MAG: FG-GAP-like repeat-containing protein [Acidobacteriaceae bacterium]
MDRTGKIALLLLLAVAGSASAQTDAGSPSTKTLSPAVQFVDATARDGVHFTGVASHTSHKYLMETMGSGVAAFDFDNDGRLDLFFVNGAQLSDPTPKGTIPKKSGPRDWNRLYHQKKDGTFEDVTEKAGLEGVGYGMGVAVGDYDNDGYEDLYVTAYGGNRLYHNNGDGTFTDVTASSGTGGDTTQGESWYTSAAWVDLDNDGKLDLIVLRYVRWDFEDVWCGENRPGYRTYCHPDLFPVISALVFHNDGNGHFTEVSKKLGLNVPGKGLGIAINDYDHDGRVDIAVANDSMFEFLYHHKSDGTFEEVGLPAEVAVNEDGKTYAGMGIAFQDYDNDGWPDLVMTDLAHERYALYHNNGDGTFSNATYSSGLSEITSQHSGWGVQFVDVDNDGLKDLLVSQGHDIDNVQLTYPDIHYREPMLLIRNLGKGKFEDISDQAGAVFQQQWVSRGLAIGDLDNDGRLDAVVTTNGGEAHILHNETVSSNHWISLFLVGHTSNRDGIGAEVKVETSRGVQTEMVSTCGSYLSSSDKRAHFGLGPDAVVKRIEIDWPSGIKQVLTDVRADQILRVEEPPPATAKMEFSDTPNFTVAGVTDWTAVGGHGSDATLRTSESLASAAATLPGGHASATTPAELRVEGEVRADERRGKVAAAQAQVHAALQSHATATLYRLAAEVDEKGGDPLSAVREFEQAAKLDPSEVNEFDWGSDLLVHRAIWPAQAVFERGVKAYPRSVRMQTALGAALFAGARYEQAAAQLCKASDLAPGDAEPYKFMGEAELAAPDSLACVEPHLARYLEMEPQSSEAHYLYAMAILKQQNPPDAAATAKAEALLQQAVALDATCGDAYLEMGVLAAQRNDLPAAIGYYSKAIEADPMMPDAYYRLAKAYERTGQQDKAKSAFAMHDQVTREQATATERQRKLVKQFLFAKPGDAPTVATP